MFRSAYVDEYLLSEMVGTRSVLDFSFSGFGIFTVEFAH